MTTAPAPKPPPTVTPTNLSKPDALFNWSTFFFTLYKFLLFVVFTYLSFLILPTSLSANCLLFCVSFVTAGTAVFCAILPAPYNCIIASVILPAAVSLALSSA
jgi:hypothetical protein